MYNALRRAPDTVPDAAFSKMVILETAAFTRRIRALLDDESYRELQNALLERPQLGDLISGSGGIRKLRWAVSGRGKRGGARILYYWITTRDQVFMLTAYPKSTRGDLTKRQLALLSKTVEEELHHG